MRKLILAGLAAASLAGGAGAALGQPLVERWGHWDPAWGVEPGPPPRVIYRHWRHRENMWYAHVHNCMVRERYDWRHDRYWDRGRWRICVD